MNSGELCRTVVQTGLVLLLQTSLVLLLGLGLGWALRQRGPQAQSLVYRAALVAALLIVLLSPTLVPRHRALWQISLPSAAPVSSSTTTVAENAPAPMSAPVPVPALRQPSPSAMRNPLPVDAPPVAPPLPPVHASKPHTTNAIILLAAGLWLSGTFALLAWLGLGQLSLMAIRRRSVTVSGEAAALLAQLCAARGVAAPRLLGSANVHSPFLAGLWRPAIFLPASYAKDYKADALRAILAHELAHWGRRDTLWMLLARLLCAAFWPQPLLWLLTRRMEQSAEEACDALALAQGCSPHAYADCLLSLAERRTFAPLERAVGVGLVSFRSAVGRRIQAILTQKGNLMFTLSPRLRLAVLLGAIAAALIAACLVTSSTSARSSTPSIVGTWKWENQTEQAGTVTFHPDGTVTDVEGNRHNEGTYQINGESLTLQRVGQRNSDGTISATTPEPFHFQLNGDVLILTDKSGHRMAATRIADAVTEAAPPSPAPATVGPTIETDLLAGLTPVQGPGLIVALRDSKMHLTGPPSALGIPGAPNLIHDTDINQTVNELKAAGAEAIAVNNQRLVGMSPIRTAGPVIYVNNTPQAPPYVIKAIGDPVILETAMNLPNGVADGLRRMDPAMISMKPSPSLTLPAYNGTGQPRYAHPVASTESHPPVTPSGQEDYEAATLNVELTSLLRNRAIYQQQLAVARRQLEASQQIVASNPDANKPKFLAAQKAGYLSLRSTLADKIKYIQAIHPHDKKLASFLIEIATRDEWQKQVTQRQGILAILDAEIRKERAKKEHL